MRFSFPIGLAAAGLLAAGLLVTAHADAAIITLQNDSFVDGGAVGFQGGFLVGEMGASTLGPVTDAFQVNKVQFLFGGATGNHDVNLHIYLDSGGTQPGTELFAGGYQVQAADNALQEIDLSADNVQVPAGSSIRVAIEFTHAGLPSIARDDDGITSGKNWIDESTLGWNDASVFGITGDWIIRAEVNTQGGSSSSSGAGGASSSGTGGASSSGTGGASSSGTGGSSSSGGAVCSPGQSTECTGPGACSGGQVCAADGQSWGQCECAADDGGCSCGVPGGDGHGHLSLLLLAGLVGLAGWRRHRP